MIQRSDTDENILEKFFGVTFLDCACGTNEQVEKVSDHRYDRHEHNAQKLYGQGRRAKKNVARCEEHKEHCDDRQDDNHQLHCRRKRREERKVKHGNRG